MTARQYEQREKDIERERARIEAANRRQARAGRRRQDGESLKKAESIVNDMLTPSQKANQTKRPKPTQPHKHHLLPLHNPKALLHRRKKSCHTRKAQAARSSASATTNTPNTAAKLPHPPATASQVHTAKSAPTPATPAAATRYLLPTATPTAIQHPRPTSLHQPPSPAP
jgi:hypothetical protein